jgi:hypothetical protein
VHAGDGNTQNLRVLHGHIAAITLLNYMVMHQGYLESLSLGKAGWENRLSHAMALIKTVYHSALLKLKAGPGWKNAGLSLQEKEHYDEAIERLSSVSGLGALLLYQFFHGLRRALA